MKVSLLHISDIHFGEMQSDPILLRVKEIAACTYEALTDSEALFIVVSGDIAYSGLSSQYAKAEVFLGELRAEIERERKLPIEFVVVPGNHDCDFDVDTGSRRANIYLLEKEGVGSVDESVIESCVNVQRAYFDFRDGIEASGWSGDNLLRTKLCLVGSYSIRFDALNISWVSKKREEPGKLHFPHQRYTGSPQEGDVSVLVMHHPMNWFAQSNYREFRSFVRNRATICITGHEHLSGFSETEHFEDGKSLSVEGHVLQSSSGLTGSGFNLVEIDFAAVKYRATRYEFNGNTFSSKGMGDWADYRPLPTKARSAFEISPSFREVIEDPGAYLKAAGRAQFRLADIFVFPDVASYRGDLSKGKKYLSSTALLSSGSEYDSVVIEGEEKYGITSLLYQMYGHYHDRGLVPLYLKGEDLRKPVGTDIDLLVRRLVSSQYSQSALDAYSKLPRERKILLVDDFDDCPVRSESARDAIVEQLRAKFGRLIFAVGPNFEMKEFLLDEEPAKGLSSFARFKIQAFGNVRRSQLIRRWFELTRDSGVDDAEFLGRCDAAEKLVNGVMNKSLIPHSPLFMLTLLQSMEVGRSGELKDSALGHYYQFLLTRSLHEAGVRPEKLAEYYQYCACLAWQFHLEGRESLSKFDLSSFNAEYSREWYTVDLSATLALLERAFVLRRDGENYSFRYPYIYYFLKGSYIGSNLEKVGIKDYIESCCRHLYVRDNANTVLFLAHHAAGDFVIDQLENSLMDVFKDCRAVKLQEDTVPVRQLIQLMPQLAYEGGRPEVHRAKRDQIDDDHDDGKDGMLDCAEEADDSQKLSLPAKLAMLSKTSEILGQVLKDQYAKIPRAKKERLITRIFDGSLRALADFFQFMGQHSERLIAAIRHEVEKEQAEDGHEMKREVQDAIARQYVANLVQAVTLGLIMRTAQNVGSDDLREDIRAAVRAAPSVSYKMIEVATELDSARPIPRDKLESIYLETRDDIVANRTLILLVLNRLYMFKTSDADMKWLHAKLKIRMDVQRSLNYFRDDGKR